jgi:thioredoxin-dependent peroxiredoxin
MRSTGHRPTPGRPLLLRGNLAHMAKNVGDLVDDFTLPDQTGTPRRLSDLLAAGPVVLFFYPAAMSSGCTRESCHFRDLAAEFAAAGAQRVGISRDSVDRQAKFAEINAFDYPLLSDTDGAVAEALGVKRKLPLGPMSTKRMTFVIDTDRRVLAVIHSEVSMDQHADRALAVLKERAARP